MICGSDAIAYSVATAACCIVVFVYDALGNITKITAPGNAVTLYTYDAAGRVLTSTDPEGCVTEYGYNDYSQIATLAVNGNAAAICPAMRQAWIAAVQPSSTSCHTRPVLFFLLEKFSDHVQKAVSCTLLLMTVVVKVPCIPSRPPKHDPLLTCCPRREDL